jgi:hypothetical protein
MKELLLLSKQLQKYLDAVKCWRCVYIKLSTAKIKVDTSMSITSSGKKYSNENNILKYSYAKNVNNNNWYSRSG